MPAPSGPSARILAWPRELRATHYPAPSVLLVEAHADTRELYAMWLGQHGFRVTAVETAREALAAAAEESPDVVVAELMLPGGGPSLIRDLRALPATADALLIVLTTQTSPLLRAETLSAGADVYVPKPCGAPRLGEIMAAASRSRFHEAAPAGDGARPAAIRAGRRSFAIRERIARHDEN